MKRRWGKDTRAGGDPKQLALDWSASNSVLPAATDPTPDIVVVSAEEPVIPAGGEIAPTRPIRRASRRPEKGIVRGCRFPSPFPPLLPPDGLAMTRRATLIHPSADEVRAITENQADKLIDMLDALVAVPGRPATATSLPALFQSILIAYAQDFGDHAARQLEAYARRQSSLDESSRTARGWHR